MLLGYLFAKTTVFWDFTQSSLVNIDYTARKQTLKDSQLNIHHLKNPQIPQSCHIQDNHTFDNLGQACPTRRP
jgi:hypothetical protein